MAISSADLIKEAGQPNLRVPDAVILLGIWIDGVIEGYGPNVCVRAARVTQIHNFDVPVPAPSAGNRTFIPELLGYELSKVVREWVRNGGAELVWGPGVTRTEPPMEVNDGL